MNRHSSSSCTRLESSKDTSQLGQAMRGRRPVGVGKTVHRGEGRSGAEQDGCLHGAATLQVIGSLSTSLP